MEILIIMTLIIIIIRFFFIEYSAFVCYYQCKGVRRMERESRKTVHEQEEPGE